MSDDINSFYSTLAESTLAVCALVAAILATHLSSRLKRAAEQQQATTCALLELDKVIRPLEQHFTTYTKQSPAQLRVLRDAIDKGDDQIMPTRWYNPFNSCHIEDNSVICETSERIFAIETARTNVANAALPLLRRVLSSTGAEHLRTLGEDLHHVLHDNAEGMAPRFQNLGKLAELAANELELLSFKTKVWNNLVLPSTLLLLGFIGGVGVPLWFLSGQNEIRNIILMGVCALLLIVFCFYVGREISCLRRMGKYRSLLPPIPVLDAVSKL